MIEKDQAWIEKTTSIPIPKYSYMHVSNWEQLEKHCKERDYDSNWIKNGETILITIDNPLNMKLNPKFAKKLMPSLIDEIFYSDDKIEVVYGEEGKEHDIPKLLIRVNKANPDLKDVWVKTEYNESNEYFEAVSGEAHSIRDKIGKIGRLITRFNDLMDVSKKTTDEQDRITSISPFAKDFILNNKTGFTVEQLMSFLGGENGNYGMGFVYGSSRALLKNMNSQVLAYCLDGSSHGIIVSELRVPKGTLVIHEFFQSPHTKCHFSFYRLELSKAYQYIDKMESKGMIRKSWNDDINEKLKEQAMIKNI